MKVDRRNGGAPEFVMFTESIPPGQAIPPHRHPSAGEIFFVYGGTGLAVVGGSESTVRAGATIYMPRNTSVRIRNTGTEPLRIAAIFSQPGYDEYMRDISVADGEAAKPLAVEELTAIRARHRAHAIVRATVTPAGGHPHSCILAGMRLYDVLRETLPAHTLKAMGIQGSID